jgi:hypothetical protein
LSADLACSAASTIAFGAFGGYAVRRWWVRVLGTTPSGHGPAWLALVAVALELNLFVWLVALAWPLAETSWTSPTDPVTLDLVLPALVGVWLTFAARGVPWADLRRVALPLVSIPLLPAFLALVLGLGWALATGHPIAVNPSLVGGEFTLHEQGQLSTLLALVGARLALSAPTSRPAPEAEPPAPDADGLVTFTVRTYASSAGARWAALSALVPFVGVALALAPRLGPARTAVVRVWGEAVEVEVDGTRTRIAMAGGSVHQERDFLGGLRVALVGRDGAALALEGVADDVAPALVAALEEATRAPPAPAEAVPPEAVVALRSRVDARTVHPIRAGEPPD